MAAGASATAIGVIEGIAEATAPVVKVFSGTLSDYLRNRKWLAVAGYGRRAQQAAVRDRADARRRRDGADRRPDRQGNPRCAARCAGGRCHPVHLRGAAYGLRQSLDTVGAFLGPLLAVIIMLGWHDDFRLAFWLAVIPGVLAVALLAFGIEEPARAPGEPRVNPIRRDIVAQLGARYWWVVAVGAVFALARFSEAFLVLRAMGSGVPVALVPLVMVAMNVVYALSAYPFGKLADTTSHKTLMVAGRPVARRRYRARTRHALGNRPVGVALWGPYGDDAGVARDDGRACRAVRIERHGVRCVQSAQRRGDARVERRRGHPVGSGGCGGYVLRRGRVQCGDHRVARLHSCVICGRSGSLAGRRRTG